MNRVLAVAAGAALLAAGSADLSAQATRNGTATITIPEVLAFDVTNPNVTIMAPAAADFDAGFRNAEATTVLTHRANVRHSITIKAEQANFTAQNPNPATLGENGVNAARATKPATDLRWSTDGGASFTQLTTSEVKVVNQTVAGGTAATNTVSYRVALAWSQDSPGQYSLPFTFRMFAD
jgi:hypothetical protein